jgi:hypothetical protein
MNDVLARQPECPTRVLLPLVRRGRHNSVSFDFDSISNVNLSQKRNEVRDAEYKAIIRLIETTDSLKEWGTQRLLDAVPVVSTVDLICDPSPRSQ